MTGLEGGLVLADVLAAPVVARTNPEVATAAEELGRHVRWVHSTEIQEIAPLLQGGEVLLTAGLGLAGAGDRQLRDYIHSLADQGVAALFLELGRTFSAPPPALLEAARERSFPVVILHNVVPFVEITQAVHRLLLRREHDSACKAQEIDAHLHEALLLGSGLAQILRRVSRLGDAFVQLTDSTGRSVASTPDRMRRRNTPTVGADVVVRGQVWGRIELQGDPDAPLALLAERAAVAVGISLAHSRSWESGHPHAQQALLRDILDERFSTPGEVQIRLRSLGIDVGAVPCAGLVLRMAPTVPVQAGLAALGRALDVLSSSFILGEYGRDLTAVAAMADTEDETARCAARRAVAIIDRHVRTLAGGRVIALAIGRAADNAADLILSLQRALESQCLMLRFTLPQRSMLASDAGVHGLLDRLADDPELERFVTEQLGRVLDYDASHRTALLPTLEQLVASGGSKARTSAALGVRRQTVYRRLEQIERLVGGSLSDPDRLATLNLALKARAIRNTGQLPTACHADSTTRSHQWLEPRT